MSETLTDPADQLAALKAAVKANGYSRSAYGDRVTQKEQVTIISEDGTCFEHEVIFSISWDSISKILGLISKRAGI